MAESSTQSIVIDAQVARVAEVVCDFARYPEWTGALRATEVLAEDRDGHASQVRFVLDTGPVRDEYVLAYQYAEDLTRIQWRLVAPSAVQRGQRGSYEFTDNGDGTCTVTYTLEVDLSIPMLGMFRRKAEKIIMDTALKELKRRVESLAAGR
jgi:ribosome-associated toxin RatA of RatAB toxin-antitoxin module